MALFSDNSFREIGAIILSPNACRIFSEASFKLIWRRPMSSIVLGFLSWKSSKYSCSTCSSEAVKTSVRINSKKHLVVASTSAVALCASENGLLKRYR
jgi:hypothetical protein